MAVDPQWFPQMAKYVTQQAMAESTGGKDEFSA